MRCMILAAGVLGLVGAVRADDPDPVQVLKAADEAIKRATSLEFTATTEGVGALGPRAPRLSATLRMQRLDGDTLGWKLALDGRIYRPGTEAEAAYAAAYDGTVFRSLRTPSRVVAEAETSEARTLLDDGAGWAVGWLLRWNELVSVPFGGEEAGAPARYEGVMDVGGTRCRVVYADYSELSDPKLYGAWWFIAESDSLPRRVEMHYLDDEFGNGFARVTLGDVMAGRPIESTAFTLAIPEGFTVEKQQAAVAERPRQRPPPAPAAAVGGPAPDFALKDAAGQVHRLADYKGKVLVIDFWATWCGFCRQAMPTLQQFHEKYRARGVEIVGIATWENSDPVQFMKEKAYTYSLLLEGDELAAAMAVSGLPTLFVIGADGRIVHQEVGFDASGATEERLVNAIEAAIKAAGN